MSRCVLYGLISILFRMLSNSTLSKSGFLDHLWAGHNIPVKLCLRLIQWYVQQRPCDTNHHCTGNQPTSLFRCIILDVCRVWRQSCLQFSNFAPFGQRLHSALNVTLGIHPQIHYLLVVTFFSFSSFDPLLCQVPQNILVVSFPMRYTCAYGLWPVFSIQLFPKYKMVCKS